MAGSGQSQRMDEVFGSDAKKQYVWTLVQSSAKTSIPHPQMSCSMEKTRASCYLPLPPRCEYPYRDVPLVLETPLLEPENTNTSYSSAKAEAFFIRIDVAGSFHTYPRLGGPFQSLQEAENAIVSHLDDLRSPIMCTDGLSHAEIGVRHELYWLDGTRKNSSKGNPDRRNISLLVQALLDKYNEDHHFRGDLAYELDDVLIFREFYMGEMGCLNMYYHLNFTTKTKRADGFHGGINNLFFAEVAQIEGENEEYVLNCLRMVKPSDNGRCYGCMSYGNVDLKHPVNADKYEGLYSGPFNLCCGVVPERDVGHDVPTYIQNEDDRLADEEAEIRRTRSLRSK
uniref:DUF3615 domain-containing protein n=1 Tax=Aegilops tauschii TaxID=37682 RepID=R7W4S3_AEGTA